MNQGLLLALSLVGGRVSVGAEGMKNIAAVAPIVRRDDRGNRPDPVAWVVWDEALRPWVAVSRNSPTELRAMVPNAYQLATIGTDTLYYGPLVGTLPPEYLIVAA